MEISLKVQNIGANYNPDAKNIVITHEFDVPSEQFLMKRGRLFITLKIGASGNFNLKDTASLFLDSVQENFYRLTEETPLHSLEKALNRATKLALTMKSKDESMSLGSVEANFKLNFATALIWNRVLYTSYFGSPAVYLVRGTGVRNLSLNPAINELWTNSGILDNQDVIIIGTDKFAKVFPANEIINSLGNISQTISSHPDKDELAALLIKVTTSENRNQSSSDKASGSKLKDAIYTSFWKLKARFNESDKLSDRFKFYQSKKVAPVSSITGLTTPHAISTSVNMPKGPKRISSSKNNRKNRKKLATGLAMVAAFVLAFYQVFAKPQGSIENDITVNISSARSSQPEVMGTSTNQAVSLTADSELHPAIMDLNSLGGNPTITGLSTTQNKIMILDGTNKRLYSIDPETKESRKVFEGFDESALPQFLECGTVFCYVGDSAKFYLLDPEKPEKVDDYMYGIDGIQDIYPYGDFLYLLAKDKIYTYKIGGTDPEAIEWLSSGQTIENARSIFINSGVIYVITDSEIVKFSNKRRDVIFKLDYSKVSNPISLGAANGWLYVLDVSDNVKALQVFHSNTGEFVKTIELARENEHPKFFTSPRYTNGKLLFEKSEVLYEVTL